MSIAAADIIALYYERLQACGPLHRRAKELTEAYNGDLAVPLPELDKNEKVAVPNLLQKGLDQMAMRIASTMPDVQYPAERPGIKASEQAADIRRKATFGWWQHNQLDVLMGRRSRQMLGYATSPVRIRWDPVKEVPRWVLGQPLSTYPARGTNPDDIQPSDCIFTHRRTLGWLKRNYPEQYSRLAKGDTPTFDTQLDMLEYVDGGETVLLVIGEPERDDSADAWGYVPKQQGAPYQVLERVPNRIGECPVAIPGRIALGRRQGAFDGLIGLYQAQAKLMALEVIAVTEGVWPKTWLVARPNENAQVLVEADPKHGITGVVTGGAIEQTQLQPGYKTTDTIDRLYNAQLVEGGIPPDLTGQSGTNIRTGKRGDAILSAVIDFPVQEAQRLFERSLEIENRIAMATAKEYGPSRSSFYVNWKGARGKVDYQPAKDFTSFVNFVSYPHAGADINQLVVGLGQRLATRLISRESARRLDPLVDDPDFEDRQTTAEALQDALLGALGQDVAKGTYTAVEVSEMVNYLREHPEATLAEAVQKIQQAHQQRQAQPPPMGAPEGQPGLAPGPQGPGGQANPGQPPPGQIGPSPNEAGLASLLGALHSPAAMAQAS